MRCYIGPVPNPKNAATKRTRVGVFAGELAFGGMTTLMLRIANQLRRHGMDVDLFTTEHRCDWPEGVKAWGFEAVHLGQPVGPLKRRVRAIGEAVRSGGHDVVVLATAPTAQASLSMLPDNIPAIIVPPTSTREDYVLCETNSRAWNAVVALNPGMQLDLERMFEARRVALIPNAAETVSDEAYATRAGHGGRAKLLFVGRLYDAHKGDLLLPEILKRCGELGLDAELTIAGDGPDRKALEQAFEQNGLSPRVTFTGPLIPAEVYRLMLASHVLLMPSRTEGMPQVMLEAMACGCVPVAGRLPATEAVIQDGKNGMIPEQGDVRGFAAAAVWIYSDAARWAAMGEAARQHVIKEYSVEQMGRKYAGLVEAVVRGEYPLTCSRTSLPEIDLRCFGWRDHIPPRWLRAYRLGKERVLGRG